MRYLVFFLFVGSLVIGCKEDKIDLSGNTVIQLDDFLKAFTELKLPITIADSNFNKLKDSSNVSMKVLKQFIPDSVLNNLIKMNEKTNVHLVGKIKKTEETYLLIAASINKANHLIVFVLDEKNNFITYKMLMNFSQKDEYDHSVVINTEPTFSINKEKKDIAKQTVLFSKNGWAFTSTTGSFINVVNETNEDEKRNNTIINPIDTLLRKNLYSGNYVKDNKNFISIRDGKNSNTYLFFVHFENDGGDCIGELKGELKMKTKNEAIFSENGDLCVIDFKFQGNEIVIKEQGSCGNYRGIKCFFNETYTKKKEQLPKKKNKGK